ncbi:hypothetical protein LVB77_11255 [Lysobacter sp. 5GHs7-4]|uniref:hypothetical protein n=1 Tax=Lysobacter sp. 5GHs7-4 TaxID=2904253 RepID=UPI001E5B861B|nr:hypothetical protein [Lysobacter sp. 5GHs7-4]UHQ21275.1 hypothetical protein LVB77_11255 [Lysobacter sp. 5GHs7-4]
MNPRQAAELSEGAQFCVPLPEGAGYAYGYIALARKGWGYLYDIHARIGVDETPPADIAAAPLALRNLLGSGGEFVAAPYNRQPWRLLGTQAAAIAPLVSPLFRVGSKVLDMRDGAPVSDASIALASLPYKEYPTDDEHSYRVAACLLGCEYAFDEARAGYVLLR